MNNVLVAIDLARENENVLSRAAEIALNSNTKLHILHVLRGTGFPDMRGDGAPDPDRCESDIRTLMEKKGYADEVRFAVHLAQGGRVYERVDEYARKIRADLVVAGKSDRSRDAPDTVSTTTERILAESCCPVLVVARDAGSPYENILVRMDAPSMSGTRLALVLDIGCRPRVTLLARQRDFRPGGGIAAGLKRKWHDWKLRNFLREAEDWLKGGGWPEGGLVYAEAADLEAETLISEARKHEADVLALRSQASRNLPHRPDALTRRLLEESPCDILVVGRA
jgi:nucleotide-binding universal stress UspA family protein